MTVVLANAAPGLARAQTAPVAPQKLTFQDDVALWTVAIKPDRTAAFEQIMTRVRDALAKVAGRRQAAPGGRPESDED